MVVDGARGRVEKSLRVSFSLNRSLFASSQPFQPPWLWNIVVGDIIFKPPRGRNLTQPRRLNSEFNRRTRFLSRFREIKGASKIDSQLNLLYTWVGHTLDTHVLAVVSPCPSTILTRDFFPVFPYIIVVHGNLLDWFDAVATYRMRDRSQECCFGGEIFYAIFDPFLS